MKHTRDRAIIYANRAACLMKMVQQKKERILHDRCLFFRRKNMKLLFNRVQNPLNLIRST